MTYNPLLLAVSLCLMVVVAGSPNELNYSLPGFSVKVLLVQDSFNQDAFLEELEKVTSFHLDSNLRSQLPPTGLLSLEYYQSIALTGDVYTTNNTGDGERIVAETAFQGQSTFLSHKGAPPEQSTYMKKAMLSLLKLSFATDMEYTRLVARYQATSILESVKSVQISIENINNEDQNDDVVYQPGSPVEGNSSLSKTSDPQPMSALLIAIIVVVVVLVLFCAAIVMYFIYCRKTKQKSRWSKSSRDLKRQSSRRRFNSGALEDNSNNSSFSSSIDSTNDKWMDDMTKKIASVPHSKKPLKPKTPLLVQRSSTKLGKKQRSSLHCIVEESESGSYSDASALSEDQRNFDMEGLERSALGPEDFSHCSDEFDTDIFLQETSQGSQVNLSTIAI